MVVALLVLDNEEEAVLTAHGFWKSFSFNDGCTLPPPPNRNSNSSSSLGKLNPIGCLPFAFTALDCWSIPGMSAVFSFPAIAERLLAFLFASLSAEIVKR